MEPATRPDPADVQDEATLRRWYWLTTELRGMARALGIRTGGAKIELTERIAARLAGRPSPPPAPRAATRDALPSVLTGTTLIAPRQRCTQRLRAWMEERIGASFAFDGPMREAVAAGGITLDELVDRWHRTRDRHPSAVAPQFELNAFARTWHAENPGRSHRQMLEAWSRHRTTPRD